MSQPINSFDDFPLTREEVNAAWVARCLASSARDASGVAPEVPILGIHIEDIPELGQTADGYVIRIDYADRAPGELPRSLFAKTAPRDERHRLQIHDLGLYARELSFYRDFGMDPGIPIPRIYFANINPDRGHFFLLMEHLGENHQPGDMWRADLDQVRAAVRALARFHAHWWMHARVLNSRWLVRNDALNHFEAEVAPMLPTLSKLLARKFGADYTDYLRFVVEHLDVGWRTCLETSAIDGVTLLHGDYHPKELFFATAENQPPVVATDWQAACVGAPGVDLHRVLLAGLEPAQLQAHQASLQNEYLAVAEAHGLTLDAQALVEDTRRCMLLAVRNWLFSVAFTDTEVLEASAAEAGVDFRERIFRGFSDALELNRIHRLLEP